MEKEEAMKILRELHDKVLFSERTALETFIPELKEPEDERIRKSLIENFKWFCGDYPETTKWGKDDDLFVKDILAWLENIPYTIDHEKREGFHLGYKVGLEKQREQKTWSEEDEKEYKYVLKFVDNILNNCGNKKDYDHSRRCYDWLKSLKDKIKGE